MKCRLKFTLAVSVFLCAAALLGAGGAEELNGAAVANVKVPFYNEDFLQAVVFAGNAEYRDRLLWGKNILVNLMRKGADADRVQNDWQTKIYPLNARLPEIAAFWKERSAYCEAVIFSENGTIDQTERCAAGSRKGNFRSPLLDLDGVGFHADFRSRQIRVNSQVKIVLRMPAEGVEDISGKVPERYDTLNGHCEMLHLDLARRRIILIGKVVIDDLRARIECDRMTILLGDREKSSKGSGGDWELGSSGVSFIYADGSVKIRQREKAKLTGRAAVCDHLVFDVKKNLLSLSGDKNAPRLLSGDGGFLEGRSLVFFRGRQQLIVPADCRGAMPSAEGLRTLKADYGNFNFAKGIFDLLGNVEVKAPDGDLFCGKARLMTTGGKRAGKTSEVAAVLPAADQSAFRSSELSRAFCKEKVKLIRREKGKESRLSADMASLNYKTGWIDFQGNILSSFDGGSMKSRNFSLKLGRDAAGKTTVEQAVAGGNVEITHYGQGSSGKSSRLIADKGVFDNKKNTALFSGNVRAYSDDSTLKCDTLEFFLAEAKGGKKLNVPGAAGMGGIAKELRHVTATGRVRMTNRGSSLTARRCQLFFVPAPPHAVSEPGMFQSGDMRVSRILCDGNVTARRNLAENSTSAFSDFMGKAAHGIQTLKAQRADVDMLKHYSLFTDKFSMQGSGNSLLCDMAEVFARPVGAVPAGAAKKAVPANVDADPFDLPVENSVPEAIMLGKNLELTRIICSKNVVMTRVAPGEKIPQKLFCDKAVFDSASKKVICSCKEGRRPRLCAGGMEQEAERYILDLKKESFETEGDTEIK